MEKVTETEVKTMMTMHEFFCDECGTKIGEAEEGSDGWYPEY